MKPHGIQDFRSAKEAKESALQYFPKRRIAIMERNGSYGWCVPLTYARRIARTNAVNIVEIVK